jgi:dihydrofolate reductase
MRKLKLQMQMSVDGFVAGPNGELDWMTWDWDQKLKDFVTAFTEPVDTILLGRKMAGGFIQHWTNVTNNPDDEENLSAAKKFVETPKVVFSRTLTESEWANTTVENDLIEGVGKLKDPEGGDIVVYGGADFVSSLVKDNLIDDYYLFTNPTAIGEGLRIFGKAGENKKLNLVESTPYECGIVVNHFKPAA